MNIAFIVPGSGGSFYCENCLRDLSLIIALKKKGHSVSVIPLYLPFYINPLIEIPEDIVKSRIPVFYGAVNLYLKHFYPVYEKFPGWLKKNLDSTFFLKQAARQSSSTDSSGLNDLTISMLKGEDGRQNDELDAMIGWLSPNIKPDVIHISTALLAGMARRLKMQFKVPVVSFFQDEDSWIDAMDDVSKEEAWRIIERKSADVDAFVFPTEFYKNLISAKFGIPHHKMTVIYNGLDPASYSVRPVSGRDRFTIGYLSRICAENDPEFLVDVFIEMKRQNIADNVTLEITGGYTGNDREYVKRIINKIRSNRLGGKIKFAAKFDLSSRKKFFGNIDLLSVPGCGNAFGLYQAEAFFSGIPALQPDCGASREIIDLTRAGMNYRYKDAASYIDKLAFIMKSGKLGEMSKNACDAANKYFNIDSIADEFVSLYHRLLH